jgi:hypothetical protein
MDDSAIKFPTSVTLVHVESNALDEKQLPLVARMRPADQKGGLELQAVNVMLKDKMNGIACAGAHIFALAAKRTSVCQCKKPQAGTAVSSSKKAQLFICSHNETLPVIAMCISNEDCFLCTIQDQL